MRRGVAFFLTDFQYTNNKKKPTTNDKKPYEAPALTVVSFKMEQGYAMSLTFYALAFGNSAAEDEYMEAERTGYGSANNESWF